MTKLGLDCSSYQTALPWPQFAQAGRAFAIVKVSEGNWADPMGAAHTAGAKAAGFEVAFYHFLTQTDGVVQARTFSKLAPIDHTLMYGYPKFWVDVESGQNMAPILTAFLSEWKRIRQDAIGIYTGQGAWASSVGNEHTEFSVYPLWNGSIPLPVGWTKVAIQQNPIPGHLPGYAGPLDLDELSGEQTMLDTANRGCLLGGHTQGNSSITPIYTQIKNKGGRLKFGISDEDGGKVIEWQALGVETRINRKHLPESGPNHWMEGGGDANTPLTPQQQQDFINAAVALPYKSSPTELKCTTHFQVTGNEWERTTPDGWSAYLDMCQQVIIQGEQRSVHDKAVLMGIPDAEASTLPPVRYSLPVFNAGSPHTWDMYVAISNHPIFPMMAQRGDLLLCHEGIGFDQDFTFGENQPVEQGAQQVPGAGLVNYRIFNLLWLLWQKNIHVKWGVGEWYDGRRGNGNQISERVANMIRHDNLLASSPFAVDCVGYGQFQFDNNPQSPWFEQDCTKLWETPEWQQHVIDVSDRINGGTPMPEVSQADLDALVTNNAKALEAAQSDQLVLSRYQHAVHWWDKYTGVLNPSLKTEALTTLLPLFRQPSGISYTVRTVDPATYVLDLYEIQNGFFRVTDTDPFIWVSAVTLKPV